jgi:hypothetical protein
MLFVSAMPTHTKKNVALRALPSLKRANISAFCPPCGRDRAAGLWSGGVWLLVIYSRYISTNYKRPTAQ